ncbi:MAG TPA: hypothetical protein VFR84_15990 [Candidatus Angelobacter sp.]|nr:hypothetical protein [Candidatus Angelobacter sp.]
MSKRAIIAAIQAAARELGRAPSRGELKRITGVSHYRVLTEFRSLREAVRAAGLEPSRKGEKIATEELIRDWERVRKRLGRRPSRAEYVREGKYSGGSFVGRFGAWSAIKNTYHGDTETLSKSGQQVIGTSGHLKTRFSRELTRKTRIKPEAKESMHEGDKAIAFQWARSLSAIPGPLEGKRRVTEAIAAMVVNTLLPGSGDLVIGRSGDRNVPLGLRAVPANGRLRKDRPVMGPPFSRHPLTNAPVNEMGVVFLFALVAWDLGFQVESLWTRGEPDGRAKRQVAPGKWQDVGLEFEYESKNFLRHGHDPKKCDVIVCWRHNWKECPEEIEVIELSRIFGR